MHPKKHILIGIIFTLVLFFVFPKIEWYYLVIFYLSSFLIDFDHYMCAVLKTKKWSLFSSLDYYRRLEKIELSEKNRKIFRKGNFHIFHTIEFHLFVLILGLLFTPFLYVFYGMVFHSIIDFITLIYTKRLYTREFFFSCWIRKNCKDKTK
jgi:hypothetical protein